MSAFVKRVAALVMSLACAGCTMGDGQSETRLRFWAMGREGEVVRGLLHEFERENPGIRVVVQQVPWTAAHEKLLTAHVGGSMPDVSQLGNTWMAEFAALEALEPLDSRIGRVGLEELAGAHPDSGDPRGRRAPAGEIDPAAYFSGAWDSNVIDGILYGIPWYVDTRVLFYRRDLLARAGYDSVPATWAQWREAMAAVKALGSSRHGERGGGTAGTGGSGSDRFAILLPANEWAQPVILGLQAGSPLLSANATRGAFGAPEFRRAFDFYVGLFRDGLAPPLTDNEVSNVYQEFARGYFAMYISGPWNLGEFRRRLPAELQDAWATAPLPGPEEGVPGVSIAGGSSLVISRGSRHKDAAFKLVEFLSRPETQLRFYEVTGDLPARRDAWADSALASDPKTMAFGRQLQWVIPCPKVPEWELIASRVQDYAEMAIRGRTPVDSVLAGLDREVDHVLEKRRWLLERRAPNHASAVTRAVGSS